MNKETRRKLAMRKKAIFLILTKRDRKL